MKGYLFNTSRTNPYYFPDYHSVCIQSKLHFRYGVMTKDGMWGGREGDVNISEDSPIFSPCDGKCCINNLFNTYEFTTHHVLTSDVRKFLEEVLVKESREEIPEKYLSFINSVIAGEDLRKVEKKMREKQQARSGRTNCPG